MIKKIGGLVLCLNRIVCSLTHTHTPKINWFMMLSRAPLIRLIWVCGFIFPLPWMWATCTFIFSACFGIWRTPPIHHSAVIPTSLSSLPGPHYSSLAPRELLWQLIISWHKAERQGLWPPAQPPTGPTRSPPSHLGLKLALRGATRRKCKANSFFLSGLHPSVSLPLSYSVLLSLSLRCLPSPPVPPLAPQRPDLKQLIHSSTSKGLFFPSLRHESPASLGNNLHSYKDLSAV